jgi:hypothetical protein
VEYLFGADGRFVTAMPDGWKWGPAELDPARFTLVKTKSDDFDKALGELRSRKKMLASKGLWVKDNSFSSGTLADAPEKEHVVPPAYINLRTGSKHPSEIDALASARDGDVLFYTKGPNDPDCPGVAIKVFSVLEKRFAVNRPITLKEAEKWSS